MHDAIHVNFVPRTGPLESGPAGAKGTPDRVPIGDVHTPSVRPFNRAVARGIGNSDDDVVSGCPLGAWALLNGEGVASRSVIRVIELKMHRS